MFCKVCKATRETTSAGTCSSCGSSGVLHEYAAPGGVLRPDDFDEARPSPAQLKTTWLSKDAGEANKPYVRTTSTADEWEYVWPDASGHGNDGVRKLRPADVARIMAERDEFHAKLFGIAKPAPTKGYRFDVGKEVAKRSNPGKPEWPQSLRVNISRREAIDVMRTLLNQMTRDDEPIGVTLFGELAEASDDS